jgi:hypothetical protein
MLKPVMILVVMIRFHIQDIQTIGLIGIDLRLINLIIRMIIKKE